MIWRDRNLPLVLILLLNLYGLKVSLQPKLLTPQSLATERIFSFQPSQILEHGGHSQIAQQRWRVLLYSVTILLFTHLEYQMPSLLISEDTRLLAVCQSGE